MRTLHTFVCASALISAAIFINPNSALLLTTLILCISFSSGLALSPAKAAATSKCGGSRSFHEDEDDESEEVEKVDGVKSLSRDERFLGEGGWNGCDDLLDEGEGGREAYTDSSRRTVERYEERLSFENA
jgi:hypothetical protein